MAYSEKIIEMLRCITNEVFKVECRVKELSFNRCCVTLIICSKKMKTGMTKEGTCFWDDEFSQATG